MEMKAHIIINRMCIERKHIESNLQCETKNINIRINTHNQSINETTHDNATQLTKLDTHIKHRKLNFGFSKNRS